MNGITGPINAFNIKIKVSNCSIYNCINIFKLAEQLSKIDDFFLNFDYSNIVDYISMFVPNRNDSYNPYDIHISKPLNRKWAKSICNVVRTAIETFDTLGHNSFRVIIGDHEIVYLALCEPDRHLGFNGMDWSVYIEKPDGSLCCVEDNDLLSNERIWGIKNNSPRQVPPKLRMRVFMRDNYTCTICGKSRENYPTLELHVDHIKPWSKGGETIIENLQTLCAECNYGKGDLWEEEYNKNNI